LNSRKEISMNKVTLDKTFTETHEMTGKCPFGGDRVGGAFGTPPTLENWYPDRCGSNSSIRTACRQIRRGVSRANIIGSPNGEPLRRFLIGG
jgi:hypothetical protein